MIAGIQAIKICHSDIGWTWFTVHARMLFNSSNHGNVIWFSTPRTDLTVDVLPAISFNRISSMAPRNGIQIVANAKYLNNLAIKADIKTLLKIFKSILNFLGRRSWIKEIFKNCTPCLKLRKTTRANDYSDWWWIAAATPVLTETL